jgi:integrase
MAEPFKKRDRWWSAFKDRDGKWRYLPLSATTKADARRLNMELQVREDRIREGLDVPKPVNIDKTVGDLLDWWLEHRLKKTRSFTRCAGTVRKHVLSHPIARLAPAELTPGRVDDFLCAQELEFSASTVNHLRAYIRSAFNAARTAERFVGNNPVTRDVKKRKVARRKPLFLKPEWVPLVLDNVPERWRGVFATGIYAGLRKGEILALRKEDVDLEQRLIFVRRSNDSDITKGGHEDGIPIAEELLPYLREAITSSPSELLFPKPDGTQHPEGTDLASVIRTALRKARIVTGYVHKCRRKGCGHQEESTDGEIRHCPKCGMKLWPVGKVIPIRFHDTRHTTASLLIMFGANPAAVQRILRHSDIRVTMDLYTHLSPNYLRSEIDKLSFRPRPTPEESTSEARSAVANDAVSGPDLSRFTSPVLPPPDHALLSAPRAIGKSQSSTVVGLVGAAGFEPTTSCSQSRRATNCATPRFPPETGERAQILAEPCLFAQQPCVARHFFAEIAPRAWDNPRKAAARWDRRFFSPRSISAMVRPSDGMKKSGS